jgi:Group II intron, maturase-specific domain/Phage integrase family
LSEVIETINPIIRGWENYYCRSHVRKRFHQLDGWITRRLWSHRTKRWRNAAWKEYPTQRLPTEFQLVTSMTMCSSVSAAARWRASVPALVERAGIAAGLDFAVHPHMLRHACGYRLANEGKHAFAIQGRLGHQSLRMTKGYCAWQPIG